MTAKSSRHWSDWVGLVAFTALGVSLWRKAPEFGVLIIPGLLQELLVAVSFLVRGKARQESRAWFPRLVAYANSFIVMAFLLIAAEGHRDWVKPTPIPELRSLGTVLWLGGAVLSLWPLWYLRKSFSLEPAARTLVVSGPYRFARHPVYTVYLAINAGIFLRHLTLPFGAVLVAWVGLLLLRMRFEEAILSNAFPEYTEYRRRVGAFGPRLASLQPLRQDR